MKPILNKWQLHGYFGHEYTTMERFAKKVELGILNIHILPAEDAALTKRHYKGFLIKFYIWLPIDW